jgi:hypothetical protein
MAQTSWPFENIDTSETQYSLLFRNVGQGVVPDRANELEAYADSSGMTVKLKTGDGLVRGHYYNSTTEIDLTIATADVTNPRIDRVVLRLDPTANTIVAAVLAGTPDASPSPAALTQSDGDIYEFPIALVQVDAGHTTITSGDVTDQRVILASTATLQAAIGNPLASFVIDATTARTLTVADSAKTIRFTSGSATVVTVNASTDLVVGARVDIIADGAGELTVAADGATIKAAEISTTSGSFTIGIQYSAATLLCVATDEYRLIGNVEAV